MAKEAPLVMQSSPSKFFVKEKDAANQAFLQDAVRIFSDIVLNHIQMSGYLSSMDVFGLAENFRDKLLNNQSTDNENFVRFNFELWFLLYEPVLENLRGQIYAQNILQSQSFETECL